MRGTMLWFNEVKDFGFISTEEDERLYVHGTGFFNGVRLEGRCKGFPVEFSVTETEGLRKAEDVKIVEDAAPRRARRRHSGR